MLDSASPIVTLSFSMWFRLTKCSLLLCAVPRGISLWSTCVAMRGEVRWGQGGEGWERLQFSLLLFTTKTSKGNNVRTVLPDYEQFFTFELFASRSSKLDLVLIGFDDFFCTSKTNILDFVLREFCTSSFFAYLICILRIKVYLYLFHYFCISCFYDFVLPLICTLYLVIFCTS